MRSDAHPAHAASSSLAFVAAFAAVAHDGPQAFAASGRAHARRRGTLLAALPASRTRQGAAPVRRPRPRRLALHAAQPQRRRAEGARRAAAATRCMRCSSEALSAAGYRKVVNIIELELVLREIETFGLMRDPERYHLTIYGTPSRDRRVGLALRRPSPVAQLHARGRPHGGGRAELLRRQPGDGAEGAASGPARARRGGGRGARAARARSPTRSASEAVFDTRTFGDIVTRNADKVDPLKPVGIAAAQIDEQQRAQLVKLIEVYARNFEPGLADGAHGARARGRRRERSASAGPARPSAAGRTTTACRGRCSSSSTTARRTAATTSTRCGATSTATSAATCCASTTRTRRAPRHKH